MFANLRLAAFAVALLPLTALAAGEPISFTNLNVAAMPGMAAAYPTVTSTAEDAILSASAECCAAVELHTHLEDNGILRMRKVDSVPLKAGVPTVFKSGGLHIMFIGFKKQPAPGDTLPVTFRFAHAPEQTVTFAVVSPQALHESADSPKHHH